MLAQSTSPTSVKIRLVEPHEGPVLQAIMRQRNVPLAEWVNWSLPIGPFWLLAVKDDLPIGCICVSPGHPVGRLEWLVVRDDIPYKDFACAIRDLGFGGMAMLKSQGSQLVACQVDQSETGWQRVLQRRGFIPTSPGTLYVGGL